MSTSKDCCLLVTPHIPAGDTTGLGRQQRLIDSFIRAAKQAGLESTHEDGFIKVQDLSPDLIEMLLTVDILVVDVNGYEAAALSPLLSYVIAVGHYRGNRTILLTTSTDHLPSGLHSHHHIIRYDENDVFKLLDDFERIINRIQTGKDKHPDNPIQQYLYEKMTEEERTRYQERIHNLEQRLRDQQQHKRNQRIKFRRVDE